MSDIKEQLAALYGQGFISDVYQYRKERLKKLHHMLGEMQAILAEDAGTSTTVRSLDAGIVQLQNFISQSKSIPDLVAAGITATDDRLAKLKEPPAQDKLLKALQTSLGAMLQNVDADEPITQIAWADILITDLLDQAPLFKEWIADEHRFLLQVTLEFEQVLAHASKDDAAQSTKSELRQLLQILTHQVDEMQASLQRRFSEACNTLVTSSLNRLQSSSNPQAYKNKKIQRRKKELADQLQTYAEAWRGLHRQRLQKLKALSGMLRYFEFVQQQAHQFIEQTSHFIGQRFLEPQKKLKQQLHSFKLGLEAAPSELKDAIASLGEHLKSVLDKMEARSASEKFLSWMDQWEEELHAKEKIMPAKAVLITRMNRNDDPPTLSSREIYWRTFVAANLNEHLLKHLRSDKHDIEAFVNRQITEIKDINEMLQLAFEPTEGNEQVEVPQLEDAIDRSLDKIDQNVSKATHMLQRLTEPWKEGPPALENKLFALLYEGDEQQLKVMEKKLPQMPSKAKQNQQAKPKHRSMNHGWNVWVRFTSMQVTAFYRRLWASWKGKKEDTEKQKKYNIRGFLDQRQKKWEAFPKIYSRLFDDHAKVDARHYVGMDAFAKEAETTFEQWQADRPAALQIIGEKGSGKSILVDMLTEHTLAYEEVLRITPNGNRRPHGDLKSLFNAYIKDAAFSSIEEVGQFLDQDRAPRVIMIEDIHALYLRYMHGYESIDQLLYLMSETSDHVFWVISCARYAGALLDQIMDLGDCFSHTIQTDALDDAQIKELILSHHHASGYQLVFDTSSSQLHSGEEELSFQEQQKEQDDAQEKFFHKLAKKSGGNASVAINYWISSIQTFDEDDCYVSSFEKRWEDRVDDFDADIFFALAALILHGPLSVGALALTQNMDEKEARFMLYRMERWGLLKHQENETYKITPVLYRPIVDALNDRNILHC